MLDPVKWTVVDLSFGHDLTETALVSMADIKRAMIPVGSGSAKLTDNMEIFKAWARQQHKVSEGSE